MQQRDSLSLNDFWRFAPDPRGDGEARGLWRTVCDTRHWREVMVPSCFEAGCPDLDFYEGVCWYRRAFHLPADWQGRRVVLRFEAVNDRAQVWLNGALLGESRDGFLPFEFVIQQVAVFGGENVLVVAVDNAHHAGDVPGMHVGWRRFGGIIREVDCYVTEMVYLDDLFIEATPGMAGGEIACRARVRNTRETPAATTLEVTLTDAAGTALAVLDAATLSLESGETAEVLVNGVLADADCWSPETPTCYRAVARLREGEAALDTREARFGVRKIEAVPDGLLLNGRRIFLTGFNRHEDSPRTDMATDLVTTRRDLDAMKAAGANFVRLCHYPHHPAELEMCDEIGLLAFAEIPLYFWRDAEEGRRTNAARVATAARQLERLIARDRNHPSVIFWSVSNETHEGEPEVAAANRALIRRARELDPTRLCVHVSNHWTDAPNFAEDDVICVNGYPSMNWEGRGCSAAFREGRSGDVWRTGLATLRRQFPDKPILITEFGFSSLAGTDDNDFDEETHARVLAMEFAGFDAPYICGATIWCWADHAWDVRRFHGGLIVSPFGVLTRDRRPLKPLATARALFRAHQRGPSVSAPPCPNDDAIIMVRPHLRDIPVIPFPEGYGIRSMTTDDIGLWTDIQRDAEPYLTISDTLFHEEFGENLGALPYRCFLVTAPRGRGIGTISAWYDRDFHGGEWGRIHWVAIRPAEQGKGLAKAAMSHALTVMARWHDRCVLQTSIERLAAIKVYLDFGFVPDFTPARAREHWQRAQAQLGHPALADALARVQVD